MDVKIILPKGALGADKNDNFLDAMLRKIALACPHDEGDWVEKYGTSFENDVFMMKPFCWCEREDCAWCGGCDCPDSAFHYFVDGKEVSGKEYQDFFVRETYEKLGIEESVFLHKYPKSKRDKWFKFAEVANRRRDVKKDDVCDYCTGKGLFSQHGSIAGHGAPNFWHKPSGFRVWWYKYIGRDMEIENPTELVSVLNECLLSL